MLSCFIRVQLFVNPRTVARQAPLFIGFSSKNTGVGCHFSSKGSSRPRDCTHVSHVPSTGWQVLYHWATMEWILLNGMKPKLYFLTEGCAGYWFASHPFQFPSITRAYNVGSEKHVQHVGNAHFNLSPGLLLGHWESFLQMQGWSKKTEALPQPKTHEDGWSLVKKVRECLQESPKHLSEVSVSSEKRPLRGLVLRPEPDFGSHAQK